MANAILNFHFDFLHPSLIYFQVVYAYCWLLNNSAAVGWTGKRCLFSEIQQIVVNNNVRDCIKMWHMMHNCTIAHGILEVYLSRRKWYQLLILSDPGEIIVLLCHSSNALQSKLKIAKHCESTYKDLSECYIDLSMSMDLTYCQLYFLPSAKPNQADQA